MARPGAPGPASRVPSILIVIVALLVLTVPLTGCLGQDGLQPADSSDASSGNASGQDPDVTDPTDTSSTENDTSDASEATNGTLPADANPWQRGLATHYPTPDVAEERSREDRRSNVAPPGDPEFAAFDAKVEAWMEVHDVPTGQLALMHDGRLRYVNAYGPTDRDGTDPANGSTMFRLASVTKPITAAIVGLQVEQGLYNWSDPVFCLGPDPAPDCRLPLEPHPGFPVVDDRLGDVTVRHLVEHEVGWGGAYDHLTFGNGTIEVAQEMGIESPPPAWRLVQFLMGKELVHDPGAEAPYCNVCYMTAALVTEAATGASFQAQLDAYIARPLGLEDDIEMGRTLPSERNPREPFYRCEEGAKPSVFDPNETTCLSRGEFSLEVIRGNGGLIATAAAVAAVYNVYPDFAPEYYEDHGCPADTDCFGHTGGLPGTRTGTGLVEEGNGSSQFVFLFNARTPTEACQGPAGDGDLWDEVPAAYECDVGDLMYPMFTHTAAWGDAETERGAGAPDAAPS